jgi:hypothetical protein
MRPSFIVRFYNIYTPMLGRWAITYNYKVQNIKIDSANMDHCGFCYIKNDNNIDNDDDLWPYCI